jgi:amidophosphoribosyltransferase
MPQEQSVRDLIARMKLIPINSLIEKKRLLFIEDSIVRGTQMRGLIDFLFARGAKELHLRPACPPILYGCKYLNFTSSKSDNERISRQTINRLEGCAGDKYIAEYADYNSKRYRNMVAGIRESLNFTTLEYHSLCGLLDSIGIDKCRLCTFCWNGEE